MVQIKVVVVVYVYVVVVVVIEDMTSLGMNFKVQLSLQGHLQQRKGKVVMRARGPIRPALKSGFCSMK